MLQTAAMALPVTVALGLASGNNRAGDGLAPRGVFPPPASESEDGVGHMNSAAPAAEDGRPDRHAPDDRRPHRDLYLSQPRSVD